jgi:hypothetical protein
MKRITTLALLSVAVLIAVPVTNAQVQLKANVPFAFTAADKPLPAGEYTISSPDRGLVRLVSSEQGAIATVPVAKSYTDPSGKNLLVFAKYGNQYFLRQVLSPTTERLNVNIPMFNREKKARSGEGILIAAR